MPRFSYKLATFIVCVLLVLVQRCELKRIHWQYVRAADVGHDDDVDDKSKLMKYRDNRIVGGVLADVGSAPYQVSIQTIFGSHICGGVIINDHWIITAAHCVEDYPYDMLRVITGTNNWLEPGAFYKLALVRPHCMFDLPEFYHNDIAAVKLDRRIEFNQYTQPIAMGKEYPKSGEIVTLTGWGSLNMNQAPPELLRAINLTYISMEECKTAWDNDKGIDIGHICTFNGIGQGACNGDSGGPVVYKGAVIGLVNWGAPCAVGKPDMHSNVVYYRDFINLAISDCRRLRD